MTDFTDGPAKDNILELTRMPMPFFLRIVRDKEGKIDALDQLEDEPAKDEELFAYYKTADNGTVHLDGQNAKTGKRFGKWLNPCSYALYTPQPSQEAMRDTKKWAAWCKGEYQKRKEVAA